MSLAFGAAKAPKMLCQKPGGVNTTLYFTPDVLDIHLRTVQYSFSVPLKTRAGNRASTVTAITSAAIDDQGARICRTPPTRALGGSPSRVDSDDEETTGRRTTESMYTASCAARRG